MELESSKEIARNSFWPKNQYFVKSYCSKHVLMPLFLHLFPNRIKQRSSTKVIWPVTQINIRMGNLIKIWWFFKCAHFSLGHCSYWLDLNWRKGDFNKKQNIRQFTFYSFLIAIIPYLLLSTLFSAYTHNFFLICLYKLFVMKWLKDILCLIIYEEHPMQ